ncbi:MAG: saccharopine dehydrogenase C-terminal domain-containing protein [Terriglobia bacterium]|jgi:lysine 6-dehydrogenase
MYSYIVFGAGRQGTAAAYDLVRFGEAGRVTLADVDGRRAAEAAARVNHLTGGVVADGVAVDVTDGNALKALLHGFDVAASAVPYYLNYRLTLAALESGVSFCDLGGNTDIVRAQHGLNDRAVAAGVRIIPDCGMGPGMGNSLAVYAMGLLDTVEHVYLYDGGLPLRPKPPWNYVLSFSVEGLTNEYFGGITVLRDGKLVHLPCFTELEHVDFPPLGELEAFIVAGGCSTAPWTFQRRLKTYQLKILRYPGTYEQLKAFSDLGLFELSPVKVDTVDVVPRKVFEALYAPKVQTPVVEDICLLRARAVGVKDGRPAETTVDVVDQFDPHTGFSSMERTTGWHMSIVAAMMARKETPLGALPLEVAVPGDAFVRHARKRGFQITEGIVFEPGLEILPK